ncbi:MAG: gamma carbonic anhydrase family protein [Firmicutes bacterium HGW-Firmicutes-12]|jgi:carbonic anhydrase/acetyltransferase-like protein (isoleucine patch superfamily)|nr:MAG: gamma carbonic anhydrase family protein [Firmicutes bacterium HGW-Firmicutes-12]
MKGGSILTFDGIIPEIEEEVFLAPGCYVIGQVKLHKGVSVWYNSVLRADNKTWITVGEDTNIQDNCVVHMNRQTSSTKIGCFTSIGHSCVLHGCTIEDYCLIGMNATIMDNAVIGEGSIIGAGAVVSPGIIIPPYSVVVGVPGKVVKSLDQQTIREARINQAQHYKYLAQKHMQMLML